MTFTLPVGVAKYRLQHITPDAFYSMCVKLIQDTIDCSRITHTLKLSEDLFQTTQMPNPNRKQEKLSYKTTRQSKQQVFNHTFVKIELSNEPVSHNWFVRGYLVLSRFRAWRPLWPPLYPKASQKIVSRIYLYNTSIYINNLVNLFDPNIFIHREGGRGGRK